MGLRPALGIGIVQIFIILSGFTLLIYGAILFVKFAFYAGKASTLVQQIGVRLAVTGLMFSALVGLADTLGFGSHPRSEMEPYFGWLQGAGMIAGFVIASIGVLIYAMAGDPNEPEQD
jgi:cellobiose-specific phosphotransferase system component IIC